MHSGVQGNRYFQIFFSVGGRGRTWEDVGGRGRTQHDFFHLRPPTSSHLEVTSVGECGRAWKDVEGRGRTYLVSPLRSFIRAVLKCRVVGAGW